MLVTSAKDTRPYTFPHLSNNLKYLTHPVELQPCSRATRPMSAHLHSYFVEYFFDNNNYNFIFS